MKDKRIKLYTLLGLLINIFIIGCSSQKASSVNNNCKCNRVLKAYNYIEKNYQKDAFGPRKPVVFYYDGTKTSPPINKHINTVLECTDVKLNPPSGLLAYHISKKMLKI